MKRNNWKPAFALLTVTALLFGQGVSTIYAQGTTASTQAGATASSGQAMRPAVFTFSSLANQAKTTYASNGLDKTPGSVLRFTSEPVTLGGVTESFDYYYSVPRATIGSNNYLEILFSHSELLNGTRSTLTVSVDDKPLKSVFLTKETAQQGKIRIPLGADETALGFHKITITKHSQLTDNICDDQNNPANWVKIDKSSFAFLDTQAVTSSVDLLKEYPVPFVEPGNSTEVFTKIVVPDAADQDVVAAALKVATSLSAQTATKRPIPIMTESEWKAKGELGHVIAIGNPEGWTGPLKTLVASQGIATREQKLGLDYYQLRVNQSTEAKLLLLVSKGKETSFAETIHLLTDKEMNKQLAGNQLAVKQAPSVQAAEQSLISLSLASGGYSHVTLEHGNSRTQQVNLKIPSHWKITGDVTLDLKLKISPLLMQQYEGEEKPQHQLTVTVNGVPYTVLLQQLKAVDDNDNYRVSIPISQSVIKEANHALTVSFSASMDLKGDACAPENNKGRWVFVDKESGLNVPHEVPAHRSFRYWPAPFVQDTGMKDTAFLLPEKWTGEYLSQFSMLMNDMLSELSNPKGSSFVIFQEPLNEKALQEIASYNVVAMGGIQQYPSLQKVQGQLLINKIKELNQYHVINETSRYVAWVQPSIWNRERTLSVFQSADASHASQGTFLHADLLHYLKNSNEDGQIVVMSKSNEVFTIQLEDEEEKQTKGINEVVGNIPLWLIGVILAVFLIVLVIFIRLFKKEKEKVRRKK
ncbi:cellulose biosynthesis cyclic di-GMP-binding regulatory protein BcsB [Brevibacillus fortis]|uniref:cellulose biosynthesis cyclic di-GMP-binding regulatory protein BcsB n=1 Tax=Brevibacillus fortis TaxID=2126352 RepID=UPI002E22484B|nr:cellulose biosynthesis cyclic di-GMP-binding regulatory protein BcsB [Brevibacillus fortis]